MPRRTIEEQLKAEYEKLGGKLRKNELERQEYEKERDRITAALDALKGGNGE